MFGDLNDTHEQLDFITAEAKGVLYCIIGGSVAHLCLMPRGSYKEIRVDPSGIPFSSESVFKDPDSHHLSF